MRRSWRRPTSGLKILARAPSLRPEPKAEDRKAKAFADQKQRRGCSCQRGRTFARWTSAKTGLSDLVDGLRAWSGAQMSWVLRPFIGAPGSPFTIFRAQQEGNFFVGVLGCASLRCSFEVSDVVGGSGRNSRASGRASVPSVLGLVVFCVRASMARPSGGFGADAWPAGDDAADRRSSCPIALGAELPGLSLAKFLGV